MKENEDSYGAQVLGGIPFYSNLCGVRPYFDNLVAILGQEPEVWRRSRLRLRLPGGEDPVCLPIVDFIPARRPEPDDPVFEASPVVQSAIDLCHKRRELVFFDLDTDTSHPDVFMDPDGFWREQAVLRDQLATWRSTTCERVEVSHL